MDDPYLGCFDRESELIILPDSYKVYKQGNTSDIPQLPAFNANATTKQSIENNKAGDSNSNNNNISGSRSDSDSNSNSDSNSGIGELTKTAAPTKKRLHPKQSQVTVRRSKRIDRKRSRGRRV